MYLSHDAIVRKMIYEAAGTNKNERGVVFKKPGKLGAWEKNYYAQYRTDP